MTHFHPKDCTYTCVRPMFYSGHTNFRDKNDVIARLLERKVRK